MKTKNILLIIILFASVPVSATVHRVNNNGFSADHTDLQVAIDASSPGDTIHLEASAVEYGNAIIDKQLTILGAGYYHLQNPGLQAKAMRSWVNNFDVIAGAEGSLISGLYIDNVLKIKAGNITFKRNWILTVRLHDDGVAYSDITFLQCYIPSKVWHFSGTVPTITNLLFANCFIGGHLSTDATTVSGTVVHCIINSDQGTSTFGNMEVFNSILYAGNFGVTNSFFHETLDHGTTVPSGNGNQQNVDMATVFELIGSPDGKWQLKAGSPAIGAGTNGYDCGMYGGASPYRLSGIPEIPSVYQYDVPITAIEGGTMNVTISTRTNN